MTIAEAYADELTREGFQTRRTLERIPADLFGWRPHPKSKTMGELASHLAENPGALPALLGVDEYTMDVTKHSIFLAASTEELLQRFDANLAKAVEFVRNMSDAELMKPWRMVIGGDGCHGKKMIEMHKIAALRAIFMNHNVHHRGQLTVYLRLNDLPVPGIYGPSADEG